MLVTLMPSAKILLDLTLVPAKRDSREKEKHALVKLDYITDFGFFLLKKNIIFIFRPSFDFNNIALEGIINFCQMIRKIFFSQISTNVLPVLMIVTLMPSAKIMLDLTLVPAKRVSQEMEKHALVRIT